MFCGSGRCSCVRSPGLHPSAGSTVPNYYFLNKSKDKITVAQSLPTPTSTQDSQMTLGKKMEKTRNRQMPLNRLHLTQAQLPSCLGIWTNSLDVSGFGYYDL